MKKLTEQEFEAIVEEFGEQAYKRVVGADSSEFESNDDAYREIPICGIYIKQADQLIKHDIEWYGDNAYLMWEFKYVGLIAGKLPNEPIESNKLLKDIVTTSLIRKTSAALPFDLEAAKAGDVLEVLHGGMWKEGVFIKEDETDELGDYMEVKLIKEGFKIFRCTWDLRMKHPRIINQPGRYK